MYTVVSIPTYTSFLDWRYISGFHFFVFDPEPDIDFKNINCILASPKFLANSTFSFIRK